MIDYRSCTLCPRMCGVDRTAGERGFCGMSDQMKIAKIMLHHGEEPPISGERGTGAVFFTGCTLQCSYCQNQDITINATGKAVTDLRILLENLVNEGAQTIDLVTPTHFLPDIIPALQPKLPVPVVYNCGGYERVETLKALEGLVDVYLPDLKYSDPILAMELSKASDYVSVAQDAIKEMVRQTGPVQIKNGVIQKGVIIRHLVLPGHLDNSLGVMDWISETFPNGEILLSLMSQYVPSDHLPHPLNRRITPEEYAAVESWMELCGIRKGYTQDISSATTEFLPDFSKPGF